MQRPRPASQEAEDTARQFRTRPDPAPTTQAAALDSIRAPLTKAQTLAKIRQARTLLHHPPEDHPPEDPPAQHWAWHYEQHAVLTSTQR